MFYDVNFAVFMIHQQMLAESSQSNPACIPYKRNEAAYNLGSLDLGYKFMQKGTLNLDSPHHLPKTLVLTKQTFALWLAFFIIVS